MTQPSKVLQTLLELLFLACARVNMPDQASRNARWAIRSTAVAMRVASLEFVPDFRGAGYLCIESIDADYLRYVSMIKAQ